LQGALPAKVLNPPLAAILSPSSPIILSQSPEQSEGTATEESPLHSIQSFGHQGKLREGVAENLVTLKVNTAKAVNPMGRIAISSGIISIGG